MDEKLEFFKGLDVHENTSTVIDDAIVGIHMDNSLSENRYGQIMLVVAVNLLSRIYTNVMLSIPDKTVTMLFSGETAHLGSYIRNIAMDAREGNRDKISLSNDLSVCSTILSIGNMNYRYWFIGYFNFTYG